MKNLYLRAHEASLALANENPEISELISELSKSRVRLMRMIEDLTENPGVYDYLEVSEEWLERASEMIYRERHNFK